MPNLYGSRLFLSTLNTKLHIKTPHVAEKNMPTVKDGRKKNAQAICPPPSLLSAPHSRRCQRIQGIRDKTTPQVSGQPFLLRKHPKKNVFLVIPAKKTSNIKYVSKMFPTCFKQVSSVVPLCFQNASKRPSHKHLRFQKSCHRFSAHWYHVMIKNMPPTNQAVSINFKTARFPILSAASATYLTGHYRPNPLSMVSTHRACLPYRIKVVESTQWILWIKASIFHHQQDVDSQNIVKIGIELFQA